MTQINTWSLGEVTAVNELLDLVDDETQQARAEARAAALANQPAARRPKR